MGRKAFRTGPLGHISNLIGSRVTSVSVDEYGALRMTFDTKVRIRIRASREDASVIVSEFEQKLVPSEVELPVKLGNP